MLLILVNLLSCDLLYAGLWQLSAKRVAERERLRGFNYIAEKAWYVNDFKMCEFELYWAGIEGNRVFGDIDTADMYVVRVCENKLFLKRNSHEFCIRQN